MSMKIKYVYVCIHIIWLYNIYFQGHIPCSSLIQGLPLTLEMVAVPMTWSHFGCGESIGWGHSIVFGQVPIMSATVARIFQGLSIGLPVLAIAYHVVCGFPWLSNYFGIQKQYKQLTIDNSILWHVSSMFFFHVNTPHRSSSPIPQALVSGFVAKVPDVLLLFACWTSKIIVDSNSELPCFYPSISNSLTVVLAKFPSVFEKSSYVFLICFPLIVHVLPKICPTCCGRIWKQTKCILLERSLKSSHWA